MHAAARLTLPVTLLALLAGCSSISFKQGAGGGELKRAEAACLSTTSERSAFAQCMEAKGWWTRSMDELSEIGLVMVEDAEAGATDAGVTLGAPPDAPNRGVPPAAARPAPPKKDPLDRLRIAMWAKAGAGGAELEAARSQCVATLGEAHRSDPAAGTVTRGLYECLRDRGWAGLTLR
jgi:hypothetical protein